MLMSTEVGPIKVDLGGKLTLIEVLDGLAAGGPWVKFKILDGKFSGKEVVAGCDNEYSCTINTQPQTDDGFEINGEDLPGDRVPELDGVHVSMIQFF